MEKHAPELPLKDKLDFLADLISQVEEELRLREMDFRRLEQEIEQQALDLSNQRRSLIQIGDSRLPADPRRISGLDHQIGALEAERRQQALEFSRDAAALRRELRNLRKEYRAVRMGVLDG